MKLTKIDLEKNFKVVNALRVVVWIMSFFSVLMIFAFTSLLMEEGIVHVPTLFALAFFVFGTLFFRANYRKDPASRYSIKRVIEFTPDSTRATRVLIQYGDGTEAEKVFSA